MADSDMDGGARPAISTRRKPRTVSSLTAQQIQHKRDLDRKAQRALRQRVKSRMQDLENDLARAKASSSDRERSMMDEIQTLREENRKLRSCLESIGQFAMDGASVPQNRLEPDEPESPDSVHTREDELSLDRTEHSVSQPQRRDAQDKGASALVFTRYHAGNSTFPQQSQNVGHEEWDGHDTPQYDVINDQAPGISRNDGNALGATSTTSTVRQEPLSPESEPTPGKCPGCQCIIFPGHRGQYHDGAPPGFQVPLMSQSNVLTPASSVTVDPGIQSQSTGIASVLPKHRTAVCPLDQILLDFISSRRALAAKGFSMDSVVGPNEPSLQAILHPENSSAVHDTSRVLAEILTTFSQVALPEKIAFMFVMFRTTKWQISPTDANYVEMPRWLRPTAMQIAIAHPAWIDNIPWPRVRDILIENPEKYPFAVFSELYSRNVTINWPYGTMDTVSIQGDDVFLNPIFEKHVRKLDNWTVSSHFREYLPEMTTAIYGGD